MAASSPEDWITAMYKNRASQKLVVYAFDADGDPVTGDAANITCQITKDWGAPAATNDANPTEHESSDHPGIYLFDLTQAETNADDILATPVSSTSGVKLDPVWIKTDDLHKYGILATGTLQSATATTAVLAAALAYGDDIIRGSTIVIYEGTGAGQAEIITDYDGASDTATVASWRGGVTPDSTSKYNIYASAMGASLSDIAGAVRTELTDELAAILDIETLLIAMDVVLGDVDDQTSQLKFNATDEVQIDLLRINNTVVLGDGDATPWGP